MAKEVKLPQLGQTMEEGTIVTVLIKENDHVSKGDVIFEVETDKATLEMESPAEGFVKKILVEAGQTVPVDAVLVILGEKDEEVAQSTVAPAAGVAIAASQEPAKAEAVAPAAPVEVADPGSAKVVRLPQLGQTMEEGTIVTVLVKEGDQVGKGDVIFEVETDKATLEMESPAEGFVKKILVDVGQTVPVDDVLVILGKKDEDISESFIASLKSGGGQQEAVSQVKAEEPAVDVNVAGPAKQAVETASGGRVFASPRAKKLAKELGVDLATVSPAAGGKRIVEADVQKAAGSGSKAPAVSLPEPAYKMGQTVIPSRLQKIVAQRMVQSKREIPCFYLSVNADVTEMVKLRLDMNKKAVSSGGMKVSFNDFILRATAMGLKQFPIMTGQLVGENIQLAEKIHIGLAIAVEGGLVAPLVKDADAKSVVEIASYSKALIGRAKSNKLAPTDLEGGCITVSSLGGFGIDAFIPIVVPGQCSIIGVGKITDTCVPVDGNIIVRKMMNMTLSVDHKVVNGAEAAQFLDFVKKTLENAETMV